MAEELTLAAANHIIEAGIGLARRQGHRPLTFVVLDSGGHVISAQREDRSSIMRFEISMGKAWSCLALGHSTRYMEKVMASKRPHFLDSLSAAAGGRFVPALGGVLIRNESGAIIGALGVTGDSGENDEMVGVEAIRSSGFCPDLD